MVLKEATDHQRVRSVKQTAQRKEHIQVFVPFSEQNQNAGLHRFLG